MMVLLVFSHNYSPPKVQVAARCVFLPWQCVCLRICVRLLVSLVKSPPTREAHSDSHRFSSRLRVGPANQRGRVLASLQRPRMAERPAMLGCRPSLQRSNSRRCAPLVRQNAAQVETGDCGVGPEAGRHPKSSRLAGHHATLPRYFLRYSSVRVLSTAQHTSPSTLDKDFESVINHSCHKEQCRA